MLIPRKPSQLIPVVAKKLNLPESTVDLVTSFFWHEARKALVEMRAPIIHIPNLGSFEVKRHMLEKMSIVCKNYLERNDASTFPRAAIRKDMEDKLLSIERLKGMCEQERQKKELIKQQRNGKISQGSIQ